MKVVLKKFGIGVPGKIQLPRLMDYRAKYNGRVTEGPYKDNWQNKNQYQTTYIWAYELHTKSNLFCYVFISGEMISSKWTEIALSSCSHGRIHKQSLFHHEFRIESNSIILHSLNWWNSSLFQNLRSVTRVPKSGIHFWPPQESKTGADPSMQI